MDSSLGAIRRIRSIRSILTMSWPPTWVPRA